MDKDLGLAIYKKLCGSAPREGKRISDALELIVGDIHTSDTCIIVVEGNTAYSIQYGTTKLPEGSKAEEALVRTLKDLGYTVTRKRKRE
jgi:hypothetical protein